MKFFLLNFLLLLLKHSISAENLCSSNKNCFDCVACGKEEIFEICNCVWESNECVSGTQKNFWFDSFENCNDDYSKEISNNVCDEKNFVLNDNKLVFKLPKFNNKFCEVNAFCNYNLYENDEGITYDFIIERNIIEITPTSNPPRITFITSIKKNDDLIIYSPYTIEPNQSEYSTSIENFHQISIKIYCDSSFESSPITFKIVRNKPKLNIWIFITISVIFICCIICVITVCIFSRKMSQKAYLQQQILIAEINRRAREQNNNNNNNNFNDENEIKKQNSKLLNFIFKNKKNVNIKIFEENDKKFSMNCTICLEEFKVKKDKIIETPCNHIFHYKCLVNWFKNDLLHPKCPNCNYEILNVLKNDKNIDPLAIQINKNNNNNNNNNNNEINIVRNNNNNNNNINSNNNSIIDSPTYHLSNSNNIINNNNNNRNNNNNVNNNNINNNNNNNNNNVINSNNNNRRNREYHIINENNNNLQIEEI